MVSRSLSFTGKKAVLQIVPDPAHLKMHLIIEHALYAEATELKFYDDWMASDDTDPNIHDHIIQYLYEWCISSIKFLLINST